MAVVGRLPALCYGLVLTVVWTTFNSLFWTRLNGLHPLRVPSYTPRHADILASSVLSHPLSNISVTISSPRNSRKPEPEDIELSATADADSQAQCRNDATVAICMVGTRLWRRKRANLHSHWIENVVKPLGGISNIEVFVHVPKEDLDSESFRDIRQLWPTATGISRNDITKQRHTIESYACANKTGSYFLQYNSFVQKERKRDCLEAVELKEKRCNHTYKWIIRDRPDNYHYRNIFLEGQTIEDLPNLVHAPGFSYQYGVSDRFALVPRKYAKAYFAPNTKRCFSLNSTRELFINCHEPAFRRGARNVIYPECDLGLGFAHELDLNATSREDWMTSFERFMKARTISDPIMVRACHEPVCSQPRDSKIAEAIKTSNQTALATELVKHSVLCETDVFESHIRSCATG
uniref:Uncharacterized protein n=1 Tax=Lotharella oceanica TaxID=641309 RepID=A0A7S2TPX2_9EUKA|mmetsp:Transcript_22463/g.42188  ORF Transcript_22463/g.42188 Transcript_22463/m.42188 type:complete len:407 (+) Transcript_22463:93-1313(+)|eukprot:CAMPEP_0170186928 /NCGR_PEP_ID=MMETSP0040_2-20121228/40482_1 /TAXON_ID=641309 /ORGANISM="Lotharella oceanica, Strain CCMP622" /LENGTH=406 /DNA_ID=CAMNT_0010433815 /DNA_START=30 /DNA_END=1250 /DNA_ORIENTATION=+